MDFRISLDFTPIIWGIIYVVSMKRLSQRNYYGENSIVNSKLQNLFGTLLIFVSLSIIYRVQKMFNTNEVWSLLYGDERRLFLLTKPAECFENTDLYQLSFDHMVGWCFFWVGWAVYCFCYKPSKILHWKSIFTIAGHCLFFTFTYRIIDFFYCSLEEFLYTILYLILTIACFKISKQQKDDKETINDQYEEISPIEDIFVAQKTESLVPVNNTIEVKSNNSVKKNKRKRFWAWTIIFLLIGGISFYAYLINNSYTNSYITSFKDKFYLFHGIKNPTLCKKLIEEYKEGKYQEEDAERFLSQALWVGSTDINDYLSIAQLLRGSKSILQLNTLQHVLDIDPLNIKAQTLLAEYYYSTKVSKDDAISLANHILSIDPNNKDAITVLCKSYCDTEDWENCYKWCLKSIEINPNWSNQYYYIAFYLFCLGKEDEGDSYFAKAIELAPESSLRYKLSKHLCFRGIPITGSLDFLKTELVKLGYHPENSLRYHDINYDQFSGIFYDQYVNLFCYEDLNNNVYQIVVNFNISYSDDFFNELAGNISSKYNQDGLSVHWEGTFLDESFLIYGKEWHLANGSIYLKKIPIIRNMELTKDLRIELIYKDYKGNENKKTEKINDL